MAVKDEAGKDEILIGKQRNDRLSTLPDDILIGILSRLPLTLAIVTGSLSSRWHGLWKLLTSLHITQSFSNLRDFFASFDKIIMQITSPVIHSFTVECENLSYVSGWEISLDPWLRKICNLNVRELKLTWPRQFGWQQPKLPGFIFQTQSLVSLELGTTFDLQLPDFPINVPNLKNLSLDLCYKGCRRLEKLTQACPSLENLSIKCMSGFKCSNQNLRRLFIDMGSVERTEVAINAPKLEYLAVRARKSNDFLFEEEPILLREANINLTRYDRAPSPKENELVLKLYRAICNVRNLTLNVFELDNTSIVFPNATRLTLNLTTSHDINTVLSFLEMCPVLDNLALIFRGTGKGVERWILPKHGNVSALRQVLKGMENEPIGTYIASLRNLSQS